MQRNFFATADDLLPIFENVERKHGIAYVVAGMVISAELKRVESGANLLVLDAGGDGSFLVAPADVPVKIRSVPQRDGEVLFAVDQLANPSSMTLRTGCLVAPDILLSGGIGTTAINGPAVDLYRAFAAEIGKKFKRVQSYWVGPTALHMLKRGTRLTIGPKASRKYDLAYEVGLDD